MTRYSLALRPSALLAGLALAACDGSSTAPAPPTAAQMAQRFAFLADSLGSAGDHQAAVAMRGASTLIGLTGEISEIRLTLDGRARDYLAVGFQYELPEIPCPAGEPELECAVLPAQAGRILLAWDGAAVDRLLLVATDTTGAAAVGFGDRAGSVAPTMAMFIDRPNASIWFAEDGHVSTTIARTGVTCELPQDVPPEADLACERATLGATFALDATDFTLRAGAPAAHEIDLPPSQVAAAALTLPSFGPAVPLLPFQLLLQPDLEARRPR